MKSRYIIYSFILTSALNFSLLLAQQPSWVQIYQSNEAISGISWSKDNNVIILRVNVGLFASSDQGTTWMLLEERFFRTYFSSLSQNSKGALFGSGGGYVGRSMDNGRTWEYNQFSSYVSNTPVMVAPNDFLFVGNWKYKGTIAAGIQRSTNDGSSWSRLSLAEDIERLVIAPSGTVYAFTAYNGIRVSGDYGESWSNTFIPPFLFIISNRTGKLFAGSLTGIYISSDNGKSWTSVGFVDLIVRAILIDSKGFIYAATSNGMLKSSNDGDTWIGINTGLTDLNILSATITPDDYIFIGTRQKGVFKSIGPVTEIETGLSDNPPRNFLLSQNFPNPFNPLTNFEFQVPRKSYVTLKIIDLLGRELATLVNEEKPPGVYKASWDASEFPSGVYLYQLRADNFIETKKMILMK